MPRVPIVLTFCLILAACQAEPKQAAAPAPPPADPRLLTAAEKQVIANEIIGNWDLEVMKGCPWGEMAPVELELTLAPDASVTRIARPVAFEATACAKRAYDSAEQAVRISSPLAVPPGKSFTSMRVRLKPLHAVW